MQKYSIGTSIHSTNKIIKIQFFKILWKFTYYFFVDDDPVEWNSMRCCSGSVRYYSIVCCWYCDVEWHSRWLHSHCWWPWLVMPHRNGLSDCHPPIGSLASASSMFWLCMIPTYHGIYIPDASHFEHAIWARANRERERTKINKSNSKRFYCKMKLLKIDTIHVSKKRRVFFVKHLIRVVFTKSIHK